MMLLPHARNRPAPPAASSSRRARVAHATCIAAPARPSEDIGRPRKFGKVADLELSLANPFSRFMPEPWATAHLPVEESTTPPSSWYTNPDTYEMQKQAIWQRNWVFAGNNHALQKPGDYITGDLLDNHYVIVMSEDRELRAFHNVCRHHAAPVVDGSGCTDHFQCPYHGWQYNLQGTFTGATQLKGIKNFYASDQSLWPIRLDQWGPLLFLRFDNDMSAPGIREFLGTAQPRMQQSGMEGDDLVWVRQTSYDLNCSWIVFNDNYLDGCLHCPFAHPGLSATLDMSAYHNEVHERVTFQLAPLASEATQHAGKDEWNHVIESRVQGTGVGPTYAFIFPNVMVNRYSMWMDTLHIVPTGVDSCTILIDYWVHKSKLEDKEWIDDMIAGEDLVQQEDIGLCNLVHKNLKSPAYDVGRYAPGPENIMHHFHQMINTAHHGPIPV